MTATRSLISNAKIFIIAFSGCCLLKTISWSLRWQTIGLEGEKKFWPYDEPRIIVFWHGQQLLMPWIYIRGQRKPKSRNIYVLISQHQDGRLMASAIGMLGVGSVSGSSTRRGREALFDLIKTLKAGSHIALSPDGPKGPPRKMKSGVIRIAQRSGAKIYPAALSAKRKWIFNSWDRMELPKFFSPAILIMGDPISVPPELDNTQVESYSLEVENALTKIAVQAENFVY